MPCHTAPRPAAAPPWVGMDRGIEAAGSLKRLIPLPAACAQVGTIGTDATEAWEYVAEKAETKLRGPVLRRLYDDIVAQSGEQGDQPVAEASKDHEEKDSSSGRKSEGSTKGSR